MSLSFWVVQDGAVGRQNGQLTFTDSLPLSLSLAVNASFGDEAFYAWISSCEKVCYLERGCRKGWILHVVTKMSPSFSGNYDSFWWLHQTFICFDFGFENNTVLQGFNPTLYLSVFMLFVVGSISQTVAALTDTPNYGKKIPVFLYFTLKILAMFSVPSNFQ